MGTRSLTHFIDADGEAVATIYRNWDGYPECAGQDLLDFLKLQAKARTGSRIGDPPYLAARYVAFLADGYRYRPYTDDGKRGKRSRNVTDFLSVGILAPGETDAWSEYRYNVHADGSVDFTKTYGPDGRRTEDALVWRPLQPELDRLAKLAKAERVAA